MCNQTCASFTVTWCLKFTLDSPAKILHLSLREMDMLVTVLNLLPIMHLLCKSFGVYATYMGQFTLEERIEVHYCISPYLPCSFHVS